MWLSLREFNIIDFNVNGTKQVGIVPNFSLDIPKIAVPYTKMVLGNPEMSPKQGYFVPFAIYVPWISQNCLGYSGQVLGMASAAINVGMWVCALPPSMGTHVT